MTKRTNVLYVVPDLKKVSGGPRNRVSLFGEVFVKKGDAVISGSKKLQMAIKSSSISFTYIESATNRMTFIDFLSLVILRFKSKKVFVFIRDVYFDFFPENYSSLRGRLLVLANYITNVFYSLISDCFFFPTNRMAAVFFRKGTSLTRSYHALPPGVPSGLERKKMPDFDALAGVLYLGGTGYQNSGFEHFLDFARQFRNQYNFFILTGDKRAEEVLPDFPFVTLTQLPLHQIPDFLSKNNIAFAFHSRPRNDYDELTYPIKVMDFLALGLPFVSERHQPVVELLGADYPLFSSMENLKSIHQLMHSHFNFEKYQPLVDRFLRISAENGYEKRYAFLVSVFKSYDV